ncbi:hypothetical protein C7120_09005 [Prevotella sp. oral taxon 376]|uniref:hypothetical protein n=1 Tax=Prevotella sp. oral taxon 376 TaxID=712466 RepID=UPI000D1F4D6F|nr:hypothetical protein [Prevotella sp. oral taxon 376]PTL34628.1 hypothetical protein C7120_09005 [Prevotella sp. oral taxon 376]
MSKEKFMRRKYDVPFNEVIPLGKEKFDVSNLNYRHKICYFPRENSIILKSGYLAVKVDGSLKERGEFVELSKLEAPQKYPERFIDSALGEQYDGDKTYTAGIQLNAKEMLFCRKHGWVATYIRSLIREKMKEEGFE